MILDIIVAVVIIGTMVQGYRHGLLQTLVHTVGWFLALAFAFIWSPKFNAFILDNTDLYSSIYGNINEKVSTTLTPAEMQGSMPTIIQDSLTNLINSLSGSISVGLSNLLFKIACFLIITLAVQIVLHIAISLVSKERNHGITGFLDGCIGMVFGFIKGIVYVFILLTLMVPIASLADPKVMTFLMENLGNSYLAGELYDNNLILLIMKDLL
ncbi:CvpA family protein [Aminipila sp.]|uniref:CvpA family protein n=1 Tax=Aminipila sp. TaxID=2060095 RepID=UPI002899D9D0|nr:CvpA family protein [Aminipila sp.]